MSQRSLTVPDGFVSPRRQIFLAAAIAAIAVLAYIPAMQGGFLWDDYSFLKDNWLIQAPDGLQRFWFTTQAEDYFPLTSSTLWAERRLWGDHAAGYHATNVLLHAAAAVLVWRALRRLAVPGAWLAGVLFAVHPVAAASAAWITERKNTLPMVFYLLSLLAWQSAECRAQNAERRTNGPHHSGEARSAFHSALCTLHSAFCTPYYVLSLGLFLLALLAKTSVVMLPVVLLLCAWWRRGKIARRDVLRSLPFFALALALGLATVWFQQHNVIRHEAVRPEGWASRVAAMGWIVWFYLFKALVPAGLCAVYPRWDVGAASPVAYLPLALIAAGFAVLWTRRKSWGRAPLFAMGYFVITLLPVLGVVKMSFMKFSFVADHFQYAALIGVIAFAAAALARAAASAGLPGRAGTFAVAGCAVVLTVLTWNRARLYADEERLWRDNIAKQDGAWLAWNNLGDVCFRAGKQDEALNCVKQSIALNPKYAVAWHNLGRMNALSGKPEEAVRDYSEAIRLMPDYASAYNGRGNVLFHAGKVGDALKDYEKALELMPHYADAYNNLGYLRVSQGQFADAILDFDEAVRLNPDFAAAFNNRATAYVRIGQFEQALRDCERAIALEPANADFFNNQGVVYEHLDQYELALRSLDRAIALKPDFANAYSSRAIVHYQLKDFDQAWEDVAMVRKLGGRVQPDFLSRLIRDSRRSDGTQKTE
jgi:tetratricopeptide (TPR) repeat protein